MVQVYENIGNKNIPCYQYRGVGNLYFGRSNSIRFVSKYGTLLATLFLEEISSGYWKVEPCCDDVLVKKITNCSK